MFHEIKFTGNIFKIDKDWKEENKYDSKDTIILNEGWLNLYDQYFEKTDDIRFKKELKNKKKSLELLLEIKSIESIVDILEYIDAQKDFVPEETYLETVSSIGNQLKKLNRNIKFTVTEPITPQLEQFKAVLGGLQTKYEILFKEDLVVEEVDIQLYYDIKAELEITLDRNLPEYMNMLQWIAYEKQYKKKIKRIERQNNARK